MLKNLSARRASGLLAAAVLLLVPGVAPALTLGEPRVESQYGQPLRLRLPVQLAGEEEESDAGLLRARLLGLEHYEAESAAPPEIPLNELEIATEQAGGQRWVVIRSRRSVREPMMTLFVNVRLGASQLTREVPVLLDFPAPRRESPAAAAAAPAPAPPVALPAPDPALPPELAPSLPPPTLVTTLPATAVPESAPPRRRRAAPAVAAPAWPERPAGYSRLRFDERLASLDRLSAPPAPAVSAATTAAPAPSGAVAEAPAPAPAAPASLASATPATPAPAAGWPWGWLLGGSALLAVLLLWRRRGRAAAAAPVPMTLGRPAPPAAVSAVADPSPAVVAAPAPPPPAVVPAATPFEQPMDLADPPDLALYAEPEAAAGLARDRYPNQALRERVTQLSRLVSTASERRKLELVKAYIDVERIDSAEKLLAELEERYPVYGRPDTVDFELV